MRRRARKGGSESSYERFLDVIFWAIVGGMGLLGAGTETLCKETLCKKTPRLDKDFFFL